MALFFLDTSALVKLYVQEPGTDRLLLLFADRPDNRIAILAISAVEFRSALRRRERAGDIDAETAAMIVSRVQSHVESRFIRQLVNDLVIDTALEMVDRYALRAYDALQLAGCLVLRAAVASPLTIVCSDRRLLDAAGSERLQVFDPVEG